MITAALLLPASHCAVSCYAPQNDPPRLLAAILRFPGSICHLLGQTLDASAALNGSVIVLFDLFFAQWVSDENVKEELIQGIEANKSSQLVILHIDLNSVEITATACDGRFLLTGNSGSFQADRYPRPGGSGVACRWIISVNQGLSIRISFGSFVSHYTDVLDIYEGIGPSKILRASFVETDPGTIRIFSNLVTVTFLIESDESDYIGFSATYGTFNSSTLRNYEKIDCTFEDGFCFWTQDLDDDNEWERIQGPQFPLFPGPRFDHTFGNDSGVIYIYS
ncbi:hypothetical protein NN561_014008 [Cricetulus griseus]